MHALQLPQWPVVSSVGGSATSTPFTEEKTWITAD
jgi:hypothetical protein